MFQREKFLERLLAGHSDGNMDFRDLLSLLRSVDFALRVKGSHHILTHPAHDEIVNLQAHGHLAKAYQVRQVRRILMGAKGGFHEP